MLKNIRIHKLEYMAEEERFRKLKEEARDAV